MTMAPATPLLRNPVFARLWFIQAANQVGGNMALYAMTILVFDTTRSNAAVSVLFVTYVVPQIVLSPFAGVVVDRLNLRWALVGPNGLRAVLMAGLALAGSNVPVLLALNLGVSLTSVALTPAEGSMIPRVVPPSQLATAMGIFNLTLQGSFALGFAFIGPVLVTISGPSEVLAVVAVLHIAATTACIGLPSEPPAERRVGASRRKAVMDPIRELGHGFGVVRRDREISRPIIHQAAGAAMAGVVGVLGPALATTVGLQPDQLVVVVLPLGLGVVLGVLGLHRFGHVARRRAAEAGLLAFGGLTASLALVSLSRGALAAAGISVVPILVGIALLAGAAYAVTLVSAQTALLGSMPADVRGRVFGVLASIVSTASLVPIVVAGPLADRISAPLVLAVVGVTVVLTAIWSARAFGPMRGRSVDCPAGPLGAGLRVPPSRPIDRPR
ncbi:MAG: MFS transporter [Candidatus Limnocylindrales bacterium]